VSQRPCARRAALEEGHAASQLLRLSCLRSCATTTRDTSEVLWKQLRLCNNTRSGESGGGGNGADRDGGGRMCTLAHTYAASASADDLERPGDRKARAGTNGVAGDVMLQASCGRSPHTSSSPVIGSGATLPNRCVHCRQWS